MIKTVAEVALPVDEVLRIKKRRIMPDMICKITWNSGNIHIDTDSVYDDFIVDRIELYRREILGTYKISGVNSDERSIILLVSMMILIPWAIFMVIRVNDKTIQKGLIITITLFSLHVNYKYFVNRKLFLLFSLST